MPESFNLDRLPTPIGTALLVTDADGLLRALDWEDYEPRMRQLLRLHYGAVDLKNARAPRELRAALTGYFKGDLDRLAAIEWRVAGTPFQQKVWNALPAIPAGTTLSYGALAAKLRMPKAVRAVGHANGSNPISVVAALSPPDRRQRVAGEVRRRAGAQALAVAARGRPDLGKAAGRSRGWKLRLRTRHELIETSRVSHVPHDIDEHKNRGCPGQYRACQHRLHCRHDGSLGVRSTP